MVNMLLANGLLLLNLYWFLKEYVRHYRRGDAIVYLGGFICLLLSSYAERIEIRILFAIGILYIFVVYMCKLDYSQKTMLFIIFLVVVVVSEIISASVMNLVFVMIDYTTLLYTLLLLVSNGITFVILYIVKKYLMLYLKHQMPKYVGVFLILPFATIVLLLNLKDYFSLFRSDFLVVLSIVGIILGNLIVFYSFLQIMKVVELQRENACLEVKYETIAMLYKNNSQFMHDITRKIFLLKGKMDVKDYQGIEDLVIDLNYKSLKQFNTVNSNSVVVSSILNFNLQSIMEHNIQVKTEIVYNNFSFLLSQDEMRLFTLLIENGIASCKTVGEEPSNLILKTREVEEEVCVQCVYSYDEIYKSENEKKIAKIKKLVERYKCFVQVSYAKAEFCSVMVVFRDRR